ncbi:MAG: hypothetical protein KAS47_07470, partial [Candidatus Heimdallarchaeota archaeon]|nr:hypothetical protein [Candidatus Heimdallarchaeota archaeon]
FWSFVRHFVYFLGYWIAKIGGVALFFFIYKWQREIKIKNLLKSSQMTETLEVRIKQEKNVKKDSFDGIFLSRFSYQKEVKLNNFGLFIIPRKGERAEIALLRYSSVVKDLGCDVFVYNKPSRGNSKSKYRFLELKKLVECYEYFQLKIGLLEKERIFILTEAKGRQLALSLSTQVESKGTILDFTRKRKPPKHWQGLMGRVKFLSLVNLVTSIIEKVKTLSKTENHTIEIYTPLILISRKDSKTKLLGYLEYKFGNLKEEFVKLAMRIKEVEFTQEFRETILLVSRAGKNKTEEKNNTYN